MTPCDCGTEILVCDNGHAWHPGSLRRLADVDCPGCGVSYARVGFFHPELDLAEYTWVGCYREKEAA